MQTEKPNPATDPGRGRRLGLDVGTVRIGVAISDPDCILATPVETIQASEDDADVQRVVEICEENFVVEVVVGLLSHCAEIILRAPSMRRNLPA